MKRTEQIVIDIDGTMTLIPDVGKLDYVNMTPNDAIEIYKKCKPNIPLIKKVNKLAKKYVICVWTSRSDLYQEVTIAWLKKCKVKYDFLQMGKPYAEYYVDDKFMDPEEFLEYAR